MTFTNNSRDIVVMHNQIVGERQSVLVPNNFRQNSCTRLFDVRDDESTMQVYKPSDSEFLTLQV